MFFKKGKEEVDKSVGKIDKLVTGLIIGWAIGSLFGLSKSKKSRDVTKVVIDSWKVAGKAWVSLLWKSILKIISVFDKKAK